MNIKFYYAYKKVEQLAIAAGMPNIVVKEPVGEIHMVNNGQILCGLDAGEYEKELGADGSDTGTVRRGGVRVCMKCQERWKRLPESPWKDWVKAVK